VRDLLALLAFLALPEDDLSLAAALRSPLFGWTEGRLYGLAHGRKGFLWEALRGRATDHPEVATLDDLRDEADFLRPYDLIERILVRHDGRARLLARLGPEAEDGIDALLNLALAYERTEVPSLTGFLSWLEAEDTEIRASSTRGRAHPRDDGARLEGPRGAGGDPAGHGAPQGAGLRERDRGGRGRRGWWVTPKNASPAIVDRAREAALAAEERERERLLYVAMTRAQTWLIVCGAGKKADAEWHHRVAAGIAALGPADRHAHGRRPALPARRLGDLRGDRKSPPRRPHRVRPGCPRGRRCRPNRRAPSRPRPRRAKALPARRRFRRGGRAAARPAGAPPPRTPARLPAADWPASRPPSSPMARTRPRRPRPRRFWPRSPASSRPGLAPLFAPDTLAEVPLTCGAARYPGRCSKGTSTG
jgi:ATP-dependent helicase/nuclease subunit A